MATYDIGDRRKLICEIRDEDGVLSDPDALIFTLLNPAGELLVYVYGADLELAKDSEGIFHVYYDCTMEGSHYWRYDATGSIQVAEEETFRVRRSPILAWEAES